MADEFGYGSEERQVEEELSRAILAGCRLGTIVDMGCGNGSFLLWADASLKIGLDLSKEMLRQHRARLPGGHYIVSDATRTGLSEACASLVHCSFVLDHIQDSSALFAEALRVMKPQARFLLAFHSPEAMLRERQEKNVFQYESRGGKVHKVPSDFTKLQNVRAELETRFKLLEFVRAPVGDARLSIDFYVLARL